MKSYKNNPVEIDKMPTTSGLYYFYDEDGVLLYIGKAKSIRARTLMHQRANLRHREGMFLRKITISKGFGLMNREEWPKELDMAWKEFELSGMSRVNPIVIDYIFNKVKRIDIEEMQRELTKSKEEEMIQKYSPPFNSQTASEEYYRLSDELE